MLKNSTVSVLRRQIGLSSAAVIAFSCVRQGFVPGPSWSRCCNAGGTTAPSCMCAFALLHAAPPRAANPPPPSAHGLRGEAPHCARLIIGAARRRAAMNAGGRTAQMGPRGPLGHGNGAPTSNGSIRGHQPARRGYGALAAAVRGPSFHMDMFAVAAWLNQRRSSGHANGPAPQPPAQTLARPRYRSGCCSCR